MTEIFSGLRNRSLLIDPSVDADHLTSRGKLKHHPVDREAQRSRFQQKKEEGTDVVIDNTAPVVDHSDDKPKKKYWWED